MNVNEIILAESAQLDEIDWKSIQKKAGQWQKGAQKFTKNVADTGAALGGAATSLGGAAKELGKQFIAKPIASTYGAAKSGLGKAADVTKGVYGDVKKGVQAVGRGVDTVATDAGNLGTWAGDKIKQAGRGVANVVGGTVGGVGSAVGGATTGIGRAAARGFNAGVKNVGGNAVDRLQTNVFKQKKPADAATGAVADTTTTTTPAPVRGEIPTQSGAINPQTQQPFTASDYATTTAAAPADTTATATTTKKKSMPAGTAKQAVDAAVSAIQSVRSRDRANLAKYAQDKLLGVGQPASGELKFTGRKPSSKGFSKQQKDYFKSLGVAESLSWSKSFDPGAIVWKKMHESK
jgi:hypothetical protein